jgi:hypothetical protein
MNSQQRILQDGHQKKMSDFCNNFLWEPQTVHHQKQVKKECCLQWHTDSEANVNFVTGLFMQVEYICLIQKVNV